VALAFAVLGIDNSPSALGFVFFARALPTVVFILVGGVWADRLPRHLVMVASDLVRFGTQGTAAGLLISHHARLWHLIVLMAIYGTGAAFFLPAQTGLVPHTVPGERLQEANALISLTSSAFSVLGPSVSGVLVATVGPGWALGVDSSTFLASAAFLVGLELATTIPPAPRQRFLAELGEGWREVRSRTWVWVDGLFSALGNAIILAPFFVLGPVVAKRSLHGPASWAAIVAAFGIGAVCGSFVALRIKPRRPLLVGWTALTAFTLPSALLAVPSPTAAIAAGAFLAGLSLNLANTFFETTLQQYVPAAASLARRRSSGCSRSRSSPSASRSPAPSPARSDSARRSSPARSSPWPSARSRSRSRASGASSGSTAGCAQPAPPDEAAPRPDERPVEREAASRGRVGEADPRFRLEPAVDHAEGEGGLRVAGLVEGGPLFRRGGPDAPAATRAPRPPDVAEHELVLGVDEPVEAEFDELGDERPVLRRPDPPQREERPDAAHLPQRRRLHRREGRGRRRAHTRRVPLAEVV
jgi:MFS family permease